MSSVPVGSRSRSFLSSAYSSIQYGTVSFFAFLRESAQALWYGLSTCTSDTIDLVSSSSCCDGREHKQTRHGAIKSKKFRGHTNDHVQKPAVSSDQQVNSPMSNQEVSLETVNSSATSPPSTSENSPPPFLPPQVAPQNPPTKVVHIHATKNHVATPPPPPPPPLPPTPPLPVEPKVTKEPEVERQPVLEPPRIDFVETGSIFGDRKRTGTDHNMYLLENGKFKSPGQAKAIAGPGGRTIRVSFLKGFPAPKSSESRTSLPSVGPANHQKRSVESAGSQSAQPVASNGNRDVKLGSKTTKNVLMSKSFKSVQSSRSQGSNGGPDSPEMKDNFIDVSNIK